MWCELALALGGRTINELKAAITVDEFHTWLMYRARWGISLHRNVEFGAAVTAQAMRGGKLADYLPNRNTTTPPQGPAITTEQAMVLMPGKRMR